MRYNTLLVGSQDYIVNEFFTHMNEHFDSVTSSGRLSDLKSHLKAFHPQLLIFCIKEWECEDLAHTLHSLRREVKQEESLCVLIGEKEDNAKFVEESGNLVDLVLERPLTNTMIIDRIDKKWKEYSEELNAKHEEEKQAEEAALKTKRHILIVDDDPNMLKAIKAQLENEYNVATAVNGSLALRFLTNKTTDLILLDYEMPGQSGDTVLSILRKNNQTKDIPVIFLTGVTDPARIAKVLALKPQGYLLKPIDNKKLIKTIHKAMGEAYGEI